jgi:hypothetical protein
MTPAMTTHLASPQMMTTAKSGTRRRLRTHTQDHTVAIIFGKGKAHLIVMIIVEVHGDDLRRFDKHKKRATLKNGEYLPLMNCTFFAVHKALKYGWVSIPYHLMLYTNGVAEFLPDLV